jgi:hypothetical protein
MLFVFVWVKQLCISWNCASQRVTYFFKHIHTHIHTQATKARGDGHRLQAGGGGGGGGGGGHVPTNGSFVQEINGGFHLLYLSCSCSRFL